MTRLNIKAIVTAPEQINIPLVRADHQETSGIFRVCFEVSLSLFSTLLGYIIQLPNPILIHYAGLSITGLSGLAFLYLSYNFGKKAHNV